MTKNELERLTSLSLGRFISSASPDSYRPNAKAEIIGWCIVKKKPYFTIRFRDNETTLVPADSEELFKAGYVIRSS